MARTEKFRDLRMHVSCVQRDTTALKLEARSLGQCHEKQARQARATVTDTVTK